MFSWLIGGPFVKLDISVPSLGGFSLSFMHKSCQIKALYHHIFLVIPRNNFQANLIAKALDSIYFG